jgi:hypothetical protein
MGDWTQLSNPPSGVRRVEAGSFVIGDTGYVASGMTPPPSFNFTSEVWAYDFATDTWTQETSDASNYDRAGVASTKFMDPYVGEYIEILPDVFIQEGEYRGLVIGGFKTGIPYIQAARTYNTILNTWLVFVKLVPGKQRSIIFTLNDLTLSPEELAYHPDTLVFYGTGENSLFNDNDFWVFDTVAGGAWTQVADVPPSARINGFGWSLANGKGYIGGGTTFGGSEHTTLYEYDQTSNVWTQRADIPEQLKGHTYSYGPNNQQFPIGFAMTTTKRLYKYTPIDDEWTALGFLPTTSIVIIRAQILIYNNKLYFVTGNKEGGSNALWPDMWQYDEGIGVNTSVAVQAPAVKRRPPIFDFSRSNLT